tara:strand:+ start:917 stop:1645 length:729 start_codon:yes stop_codon:yes gene_type:complete
MAKWNLLLVLLLVTSFTLVSGAETTIGTKQLDDCIDLIQSCADCTYVNFTSYTMPNGTRTVWEVPGVQEGTSFTYYNCSLTGQLGTWIIDGHGDVAGRDTVFTYTYEVTNTGNPTPNGMPMFQMGVLIIIFGVACFLLYLSSQMNEVGFKIFFLLTSLVFLMATMITAYMVSMDGNVATTTNTTTLALVSVLGAVLFIIFIYILIRQTINALDLFKIKKGLKMETNVGLGSKVAGYKTKRAY